MSIHLLDKYFLNKVLKNWIHLTEQPLNNLKLCSIFQEMHTYEKHQVPY